MSINPPFRAEHVGSLLRPSALKEVFTKRGKGEISESAYEATLTDVVARAVKMQEEVRRHDEHLGRRHGPCGM